jgi:hypothetical protein
MLFNLDDVSKAAELVWWKRKWKQSISNRSQPSPNGPKIESVQHLYNLKSAREVRQSAAHARGAGFWSNTAQISSELET